jgi:cell pole-organizing protein PopZ
MQVLSEGSPTMDSSQPARVLVVAHKTAATRPLLEAISERARRGPSIFTLLVPNPAHGLHRVVDAQDQDQDEARAVLDEALPLMSEAAGSEVEGLIGDADPLAAVHDAVNLRGFDEIIISTLSPRLSRWLKLDLPSKLSGLGLPVLTVTPSDEPAHTHDALSSA